MKFRIRFIAALAIVSAFVAGCGSSETDTSGERDRNVDVQVSNAKFGPNDNGIVVTPIKMTKTQEIASQSYKRQASEQAVYGAVTLRTHSENGQLDPNVDLKLVRIVPGKDSLKFDPNYNVKTLIGAERISLSTEVVVTQNKSVLLLDRLDGDAGNQTVTIRRFMLATGKPDTTFGAKGQLSVDPAMAGVPGLVRFVVEGVDGSILVGVWQVDTETPLNHILKYRGDGLLDRSFGNKGVATIPQFLTKGKGGLFINAAHVVWENSDRGAIILAATTFTGFQSYDYLVPIRVSADGFFDDGELKSADEYAGIRIVSGSGTTVGIDAIRPDRLTPDPTGNSPEELVTKILIGGEVQFRFSPTVVYKSWYAANGFPGLRFATNAPREFTDPDGVFYNDEKILGQMHQVSIDGIVANVGSVVSRGSNFQGLGLMSVNPSDESNPGILSSTIRLAEYPTTRLTATRLRLGSNGRLYFSEWALGAPTTSKAIGDAVVQKSWGVALDANGMPVPGGAGAVVASPINLAISTSTSANVYDETQDVVTVFDESGRLYAVYPSGDDLAFEMVGQGSSLTRKGSPLRLSSSWSRPSLHHQPQNSDLVVVRDGKMWIGTIYTSEREETFGVTAFGIARFDLSTGKADETYGDDGVSVVGIPPLAFYGSRRPELVVNPDGSSAVVIVTTGQTETKGVVLSAAANGNKKVDLRRLSESMKPTIVSIAPDVLTRDDIAEGPIGFTADPQGNVLAAQVRRKLDYVTSASHPDAFFTVRLWRFTPNSTLDPSFDGGYVEHDVTGSVDVQPYLDTVPQLAVQADGKVLLGLNGVRTPSAAYVDAEAARVREDVHVLARLTAVGALDAIKAPAPKAVPLPVQIELRPTEPTQPTQTEAPAALADPFTKETALTETVVTIPEAKLPVLSVAPGVSAPAVPPRLQILATVSSLDRSIGVKWAIPESLAKSNVTYEVTAMPSGKTCSTSSTLCVFRGLDAWTAYSFTVVVKSGAEGILPSEASPPAKPLRILARNKTVKTSELITPAAKGKLKWKAGGPCKLSKDASTLTLPKDAATCTLSVRSPKVGKTPAATRFISIDVRAIVK